MGIIGSIIIGCLAGFCAGKLMKGGGMGFIMNLVLGLFGGLVGGWLFEQLGIQWGGILGQLGTAIVGAVAILWIASLIKKKATFLSISMKICGGRYLPPQINLIPRVLLI